VKARVCPSIACIETIISRLGNLIATPDLQAAITAIKAELQNINDAHAQDVPPSLPCALVVEHLLAVRTAIDDALNAASAQLPKH
jgi:hypothetical protein